MDPRTGLAFVGPHPRTAELKGVEPIISQSYSIIAGFLAIIDPLAQSTVSHLLVYFTMFVGAFGTRPKYGRIPAQSTVTSRLSSS